MKEWNEWLKKKILLTNYETMNDQNHKNINASRQTESRVYTQKIHRSDQRELTTDYYDDDDDDDDDVDLSLRKRSIDGSK